MTEREVLLECKAMVDEMVAGEYNCSRHQYFMAAQSRAETLQPKIDAALGVTKWSAGDTFKAKGADHYTSGINGPNAHGITHYNQIECYAPTEEEAIALRDCVLNTLKGITNGV